MKEIGRGARWLDPLRWVRRQLYSKYGSFVMANFELKLRHLPTTARLWRLERAEAKRLLQLLGTPVEAHVITVIATYRRPELAAKAVRSALAQTVADHHIVVVDDAGGQLPAVDDPRVTVVSLARNAGSAGVVRNVGIRLSRSPIIAFLDDDNTWDARHLELSLKEHARGYAVTYTGLRRVRMDGTMRDEISVPFERSAMRSRGFVDTSAITVRRHRRAYFSRVPRGRKTKVKEDWELVYRLSRRVRTTHVPVSTVEYLVHEGSYYTNWK